MKGIEDVKAGVEQRSHFSKGGALIIDKNPKKIDNKIPTPESESKPVKKAVSEIPESKPEVTAEDFISELKPLGVTFKEDKAGNIGLRLDKAFGYVNRREYGFCCQVKKVQKNNNWFTGGKITTKKEMMEKVELIKVYVKTKKDDVLVKAGFLEK